MAQIARGHVLDAFNRLTDEELVGLIELGGELPANATHRDERMHRAFAVIDSITAEQLPAPGVRFEAIDPHQLRELASELVKQPRKTA